ncbi:MAG: hypothetical protein ABJA84_04335 [Polaromonas sp.]
MSKLRVIDPAVSDSFETALRRFFAPVSLEADTPALKIRVDISTQSKKITVQ